MKMILREVRKNVKQLRKLIKQIGKMKMNANVAILAIIMAGVVGLGFGTLLIWFPAIFTALFILVLLAHFITPK